MDHTSHQKLDLGEISLILDRIAPEIEGVVFDPIETMIMASDLSFYPGYRLLEISEGQGAEKNQRFVVYGPEKFYVIDFTNEPIYQMNTDIPLNLSLETASDYVRFFFCYVRGRHGRFLISETIDDINWKEEPPAAARKVIGQMLKPLTPKNDALPFVMDATMIFKDSLFSSIITVTAEGYVTISDEELLIEDIPVYDDVFGY